MFVCVLTMHVYNLRTLSAKDADLDPDLIRVQRLPKYSKKRRSKHTHVDQNCNSRMRLLMYVYIYQHVYVSVYVYQRLCIICTT